MVCVGPPSICIDLSTEWSSLWLLNPLDGLCLCLTFMYVHIYVRVSGCVGIVGLSAIALVGLHCLPTMVEQLNYSKLS